MTSCYISPPSGNGEAQTNASSAYAWPIPSAHLVALRYISTVAIGRLLGPDERLEIRRLDYASPGVSDLAGIGLIVGHVKDFVHKLIDRRDTQRQRDLKDEKLAVEIEHMRIENARNFGSWTRAGNFEC